ncbi:hypothetical protein SB780_37335, partial [Burkholderia sp. SIMBA_057]
FAPATRAWVDGTLAGLFSGGAPAELESAHTAHAQSGLHALQSDKSAAVRIAHARPKVTLPWASQTGNVESLVERYAMQLMESGFEIRA